MGHTIIQQEALHDKAKHLARVGGSIRDDSDAIGSRSVGPVSAAVVPVSVPIYDSWIEKMAVKGCS